MDATDLTALLEQTDAAQILAQLHELDRQQRALRVLLRAARARERRAGVERHGAVPRSGEEVAHAS